MRRTPQWACVAIIAALGMSVHSYAKESRKQEPSTSARQAPSQQVSGEIRYTVQLGASFGTAEDADALTSQLRRKYSSAHTQHPGALETLYRVRIGPYKSREDARQVVRELASQGFKGVTILSSESSSARTREPSEKIEPAQTQEPDDPMRRAITNLSNQIGLLSEEVRGLKRETERSSGMLEMLLNEERLAKLEDKIQEASDHKAQLDAREQEIQRRMRNIQAELVLRGGLRRDEAETAIRSELQRALDDVHSQQTIYQQRQAELNEQAVRLRARVETVRKKLEQLEQNREKEEK